jgi:TatD DNase family protein
VIDAHCHLADRAFEGDLDQVVERARAAGVEAALVVLEAGHEGEEAQARRLEAQWPAVRTAIGVHPHHAHRFAGDGAAAASLVRQRIAGSPAARAVGEIGLDYHYEFSPRDVQRDVFRAQLDAARDLDLPVVVHTREAEDDTLAILREVGAVRGVLHCFTGTARLARAALDLGFYLSASGIVTFPKAGELRDTFRIVPLDRLLVETDSPFLAPVPFRGRRNEPAYVTRVVEALASLHGLEAGELAARTAANFRHLFRP